MKRKCNRLIAVLLAVALVLTCLPGKLGNKVGVTEEVKAETNLSNPRIVADSSMSAGQKVTWDCVWFGSYPQTEIVDKPETCGTKHAIFGLASDYEVDEDLYNTLKNASGWDEKGDIEINGIKYRRLCARESNLHACGKMSDYYWFLDKWDEYHYFRYEKIKWRVLNVSGNTALLLADQEIDAQPFDKTTEVVSAVWADSTIRSWLNGYGASENHMVIDYSLSENRPFIHSAFSTDQLQAVKPTELDNKTGRRGTITDGVNTEDKIFLLSNQEVCETDYAVSCGFAKSIFKDPARKCDTSTTYAKAMGKTTNNTDELLDDFGWWLRTSVSDNTCADYVSNHGEASGSMSNYARENGVRPALNLDLSYDDLWTYAGTVSVNRIDAAWEKPEETPISTLLDGAAVKISKISISGLSKNIAAGKKIQLKATVLPKNAKNKKLKWTSSNTKVATVTQSGKVTIKKKTGGKSVIIKATATDGSKKYNSWKIKVMKGEVRKVSIKGAKKALKAGKTMKLKAVVKATKGANKKLQWTSSNKKYATVSSSGKVKALKAGKGKTIKITAMATDGTNKKKVVKIKIQ